MTEQHSADFWETRYAERNGIWSGDPNHALVAAVADLPPGRALDLGCGEGADSVWLAARRWQVTAIDIAKSAMTRAEALAARRGIPDGRIAWLVEDLASWDPADTYDLVAACFLHSPVEFPRSAVLRRAAASVASGGHLLIVGHAAPPPWATAHGHGDHRFPSPAEELVNLDLGSTDWNVLVSEIRPRDAIGPDGEIATLDDSVTLARRR